MYKDVYELPELKVHMTFSKFIVMIGCLFVFLVLPIQVISTYIPQLDPTKPETTQSSGRVAGVSTDLDSTSEVTIPLVNYTIDLNSKDGTFVILGILLIGIAMILIIYLLLDSRYQRKA